MARRETDREDLMGEARALVPRLAMRVPGEPQEVVVGFRRTGGVSIYFGPDPVFHFDAEGRLRRAFSRGKLFRTQGTTLAQLTRVRTAEATELRRHDLAPEALAAFLAVMRQHLERLRAALPDPEAVLSRVPAEATDAEVLPRLQSSLEAILSDGPRLAPPVRGKR